MGYSTGLSFQIPIIQLLLVAFKIVSLHRMSESWKPVTLFAVIMGAILTPSTDPVTQILFSGAILFLYCLGLALILFYYAYYKKKRISLF